MFFRPLLFLCSAVSFLFPCIHNLGAQTTTSGGLTGVVSDPSQAVVPDANVEIKDNSKGTVQATRTDSDGVYRFFFVAPGSYTLTVSHVGFREERQKISVLLGPAGTRNVSLKLVGASATVEVADEVPLLQAENGDVSTTMNRQQISEVPNPGNDLTYIAQTAPGAIMNTDSVGFGGSGNFSILGMSGNSNLFTLNGMNDNNPIEHHVNGDSIITSTNNSGVLGLMLGQNEIQEATVVSNGYSGQFGGAAGSNVNYLTKSGSNAFHGNAQYYWNGTVLNANDWFSNAFQSPRPSDIANQWAGSLGGPIKKDKLFLFFDTEGVRLILPVSFMVVLPSPLFEAQTLKNIDKIFGANSASDKFYAQMFNLLNSTPGASAATPGTFTHGDLGCSTWKDPTDPNNPNRLGATAPCAVHFLRNSNAPSNDSITSGRVDWNVKANDRVFVLLQFGNGKTPVHVDEVSSLFNAYCNQPTWQGQLNETHTIGPTAANQFLLAGTFNNRTCSVANPAQTQAAFPTEIVPAPGTAFDYLGGFDIHYALPIGTRTTTYQISDDLVKTRGRHKFGLGLSFLRTDATLGGYNRYGVGLLSPTSVSAFFCGGVSPSQDPKKISLSQPCLVDQSHPVTDFTSLQQAFPLSSWNRFAFYTLGLYAQEEWHARSNLMLTVALRADHQSNPVCQNKCFARLAGAFNSLSHDPTQPYDNGIVTRQKQAFANTDSIVWSPRFSFAWQPLGVSHNSVIRGGVGFFYDPVPASAAADLAYNPPSSTFFNITGFNLALGEKNGLFQNAANSNAAFSGAFATPSPNLAQIKLADPNFIPPIFMNPTNRMHSAQYQKWSLQAQQGFGTSTSLTVGYFGNHGIHELVQNPNANAFGFGSLPSALCTTPLVLPCADPRFGEVVEFQTNAISNYNGLVVSFEQRFTRWGNGMFQANYTYGHALDEVSNGGLSPFTIGAAPVGLFFPQDANNLRGSYGAAEYDTRHSLTSNFVWEVPFKEAFRGRGPDSLVKGWQISGTILAHTGNPYTVVDFQMANNLQLTNNFFGPIYSVPVAPLGPAGPCGKGAVITAVTIPCLPPQVLFKPDGATIPNPGALFVQAGCETGFNTGHLGASGVCDGRLVNFAQGRNRFRGPGFVNVDFAVMKNTSVPRWENARLGIGLQFFNFFNHANFGLPVNLSSDPGFGQLVYLEQSPTSILGSTLQANVARRMIQLKAQLRF